MFLSLLAAVYLHVTKLPGRKEQSQDTLWQFPEIWLYCLFLVLFFYCFFCTKTSIIDAQVIYSKYCKKKHEIGKRIDYFLVLKGSEHVT